MKNTLIIMLSILLMVAGISCMSLSEFVTPAEIDKQAVKYVVNSGVADVQDYLGYPNLGKAQRLVVDVDSAHKVNVFNLTQRLAKDNLDYSMHRGVVTTNEQVAVQREQMLFGETGLLSMGLSMLGAGGFAGLLGLLKKRPGDFTPQDFETAVVAVKGEVTEKDKQLIDIVKGVQKFIETFPDQARSLKDIMDKNQDGSTQIAVAQIVASL